MGDSDEVSSLVADVEPDQKGLPVLIRQYLKLGAKFLSFNVDPQVSDSLDGLIVVDLARTESRVLERYMGKEGYAGFISQHRRQTFAAILSLGEGLFQWIPDFRRSSVRFPASSPIECAGRAICCPAAERVAVSPRPPTFAARKPTPDDEHPDPPHAGSADGAPDLPQQKSGAHHQIRLGRWVSARH
jgi:hypothetical protein